MINEILLQSTFRRARSQQRQIQVSCRRNGLDIRRIGWLLSNQQQQQHQPPPSSPPLSINNPCRNVQQFQICPFLSEHQFVCVCVLNCCNVTMQGSTKALLSINYIDEMVFFIYMRLRPSMANKHLIDGRPQLFAQPSERQ